MYFFYRLTFFVFTFFSSLSFLNGQPYKIKFELEFYEKGNKQIISKNANWMISLRDQKGKVITQQVFPFKNKKQICNIQVSDFGIYTANFYLDLNNNQKLDKGILGQPIEPYAFSNEARNYFGMPSISSQQFDFYDESKLIVVPINYHFKNPF